MADVFISYAREDRSRAQQVAQALAGMGLTAFWDTDIPPGQTWADYIEAKLSTCKAVVVLWSQHSTKSQWVREEARMGRDKARLIPAMLDASPPPLGFGEVQAANLAAWNGDVNDVEWSRFANAVYESVNGAGAPAPQPQQQHYAPPPPPPPQPNYAYAPAGGAPAAASPIAYIQKCFRLYADGKGRARRSEFAWFVLFAFVVGIITGVLDVMMFGVDYYGAPNSYAITMVVGLALLAPLVAAASRRAHDFGQSGWLAALTVVPYLGIVAVLAFIFIPGNPGANQYGPDPKQTA